MTETDVSRAEALKAFAERTPHAPLDEVEATFDAWMRFGALDFKWDEVGRLRVLLCSPRRRQ
jgi:hypothetical protein